MTKLALLLTAALVWSCAAADERISNYEIDVTVAAEGTLDVTERITVRAEGGQIRRGIFRDFPTRYRDRHGNRVVVDLEVLNVERNDKPEPWFTEEIGNGVRINTGNDDFLPVPAEYTFTLRYRTTRQLGFFADHDELYWNAIGTGWVFPIDAGKVRVRLPEPVAIRDMRAEGYTGYQGDQGDGFESRYLERGYVQWELTRPLQPRQGLTIVLSFPKGIIAEPSAMQRIAWLLRDNRGVLIASIGFFFLIAYCLHAWRELGRDPAKGVIIARYEPPAGQSPAGLRYLLRMGYDMRCFSAEILSLAVAGCLRILHEKKFFKDEWSLARIDDAPVSELTDSQRALLGSVFAGDKAVLLLKNTNAQRVAAAKSVHTRALDRAFHPKYFQRNARSIRNAALIAIGSAGFAFAVSGNAATVLITGIAVLMFVTLLVFGFLIRAPTPEGRALMDEIEGLKLYLSVAERDELARMQGPGGPPVMDAQRYERLLPYAVALEVEDAWTEKFTAAAGAAAAAEAANRIGWYHGARASDLGSFSRALGSSLTSQIASSASPPGSSSGSGGGGSSGGGGGGGGGGGR